MSRHVFMYKVNRKIAPIIFLSRFQKPSHSYRTRFSELHYLQPIHNIKCRVNTQFQLEDQMSGIAFLAPKRSKSLPCINVKLKQN